MSDYNGVAFTKVRNGGGHVRVTLVAGVGQGNAGTSLPCIGCFVQPLLGDTAVVRVNIGAAASATVGIDLPFTSATVQTVPTFIPVDDVSNLYFYSTDTTADVDILYLRG